MRSRLASLVSLESIHRVVGIVAASFTVAVALSALQFLNTTERDDPRADGPQVSLHPQSGHAGAEPENLVLTSETRVVQGQVVKAPVQLEHSYVGTCISIGATITVQRRSVPPERFGDRPLGQEFFVRDPKAIVGVNELQACKRIITVADWESLRELFPADITQGVMAVVLTLAKKPLEERTKGEGIGAVNEYNQIRWSIEAIWRVWNEGAGTAEGVRVVVPETCREVVPARPEWKSPFSVPLSSRNEGIAIKVLAEAEDLDGLRLALSCIENTEIVPPPSNEQERVRISPVVAGIAAGAFSFVLVAIGLWTDARRTRKN